MSSILPTPQNRFFAISSGILGQKPIYFDNACLTPTPKEVADSISKFYRQPPGCPLRSNTLSSNRLEEQIHNARDAVRGFIGAMFSDEIVFTQNTTMAINLLAGAFSRKKGSVLITDAEHNSNRLPWLSQGIVELAWPPGTRFPLDSYKNLLSKDIKLVSLASVSNVTGEKIPVKQVIEAAHNFNIPVHIDAAQQATYGAINITDNEPEFLSFSLHKTYGPSGLGVLYIRREIQNSLEPLLCGGGAVDSHYDHEVIYTSGAARFEFGLQNYASQFAVPKTIKFLESFSGSEIRNHFQLLNTQLQKELAEIARVQFISPIEQESRSHICNFYVEGKDSLRLAELLDLTGKIYVRAGKLCAHNYYKRYKLPDSIRVSFGYQNTLEEVESFGKTIKILCERYF